MIKKIIPLCMSFLILMGCKEEVDSSSRYVSKDDTVMSYLEKHADVYSAYIDILHKVPVSRVSATTLAQLLTARGHYTVFAPTNDAIQNYLDSLVADNIIDAPRWDAFRDSTSLDSIRKVIAYNSVIDGGDAETYFTMLFPIQQDAEIPMPNMYDRRLVVHQPSKKDSIQVYLINNAPMDDRNFDIPALNGCIHVMNAVINPSNNTLGHLLKSYIDDQKVGFYVASILAEAAGLLDTLEKHTDYIYEDKFLRGEIIKSIQPIHVEGSVLVPAPGFCTPEHRYYGFTVFAETDSLWQTLIGKPALDITVQDVVDWLAAQDVYPDAKRDANYEDEDNLLNRFVTYHFLPERLAPDRLVMHWNEQGYTKNTRLGAAMSEFYTTMGKRRLIQFFESPESGGVCINRFPNLNNGRRGNYRELSCDADKEGIHVGETNLEGDNNVRNGIIYPIEKVLLYDETTRNNMMRGRIRWDISAMFPEFLNNNIRMSPVIDSKHTDVWIPSNSTYPYLEGSYISEETKFFYWTGMNQGWANYLGDETTIRGLPDMTFRLPPVPQRGVYELRYQVQSGGGKRGIVQFYWGKDPERLAAMGIPLDLRLVANWRISTSGNTFCDIGWERDTGDDDYDAEVDKRLRNNGFMKSPILYNAGGPGGSNWARNSDICTRRILLRQTMDPDETYYIRFKTVMDDPTRYIYMDFLEYCPKEVYDNPETPEDIW